MSPSPSMSPAKSPRGPVGDTMTCSVKAWLPPLSNQDTLPSP